MAEEAPGGAAPAPEAAPAEQEAPAEQPAPEAPSEQSAAEAPTEQEAPSGDAAQGEPEPEGDAAPPPAEAGTEGEPAERKATPEEDAPSEFREAVHAQEPPVAPGEAMRGVADELDKAGERVTATTEEGTRAWAETGQDWRGAPADEAGRRAAGLAEDGRAAGELATSVADAARASAGYADQARAADEELLTQGEGDWRLARALLPEGEREVAETQVTASTAEATRRNHAAAQANIRQAWEGIGDPVHQAAGNLTEAQHALERAGQEDPVASLPAPPSDEDLLRDYQVEDDWLPPIRAGGHTFTWSEALASLEGGDPARHLLMEDTASKAPLQVFPDPDGEEGPLGGRGGTGNNHRDAFRHAYWNALMTNAFGEQSAARVGTGHERRPDEPGQDPMFEARAEAMDMYNNQIGRQLAESLGPDVSDQVLRGAIERAVREGKLVVFNGDYSRLVPSGGAEDFPVPG
ncbi:DUF6973 domain-containing protein [Prauserella flavalba]|uniref:DUF6973 domain-containing protein n=1 Tax=Prauserella flavalba TaxID=1477506 RepID=A0A318LD08_9PSEU|nr:hypothetical protein [Prauserella flavalba]PXY23960.1 hypothetical protein BA062_27195 [Prauserella flavalba]